MSFKIVKAYQTDDGRVHQTELAATTHQYEIDLNKFINKTYSKGTMHTNDVVLLIKRNGMELTSLMSKYHKKMARLERKMKKVLLP